jgi:hypothetical protein
MITNNPKSNGAATVRDENLGNQKPLLTELGDMSRFHIALTRTGMHQRGEDS